MFQGLPENKRYCQYGIKKTLDKFGQLQQELKETREELRLLKRSGGQNNRYSLEKLHQTYQKAIRNNKGVVYIHNFIEDIYEYIDDSVVDMFELLPEDVSKFTPKALCEMVISNNLVDKYAPLYVSVIDYIKDFNQNKLDHYSADILVKLHNGVEKWLYDSSVPLEVQDGKVTKSLGILQDISQRKQLEVQNLKLEKAIEQSPVSILITNADGIIEYANPYVSKTTGYTLQELMGQNLRIFKSGKNDPDSYTRLWDTIKSGKTWTGELINRKKDGDTYQESIIIQPIKDFTG